MLGVLAALPMPTSQQAHDELSCHQLNVQSKNLAQRSCSYIWFEHITCSACQGCISSTEHTANAVAASAAKTRHQPAHTLILRLLAHDQVGCCLAVLPLRSDAWLQASGQAAGCGNAAATQPQTLPLLCGSPQCTGAGQLRCLQQRNTEWFVFHGFY
jgi:hypothetical protein